MAKGHKNKGNNPAMVPVPSDWREVLQWFVNTFCLYHGSPRGLFLSDWTEEQAVSLEAAVINLKSRGFSPFVINGETLYQQADFLFNESKDKVSFGRPLASKMELELSGNDVVIVDGLEAPEKPSHIWYLLYYLLFPRAISGKVSILTTPLSYQEFMRYGHACQDFDFCGREVNWEKLSWLIESCTINQELFKLAREESVPPMLKQEYYLYMTLRDRGLEIVPQYVLGDYLLDFALVDGEKRLNIECDMLSALSGHDVNTREAKRDFVLLSDGWQILKFSTSELLSNRAACADVIEDIWRGGRKRQQGIGRFLTGKSLPQTPELPADDLQRSAILFGGGPFALVGGSGTGKTSCIIQRVVYLLSQGINPECILLLSFSADTAKLLRKAIETSVEKTVGQRLNIMSWQDLGTKILRENLPAIKRKPPLKLEPSPQKVIQKILSKVRKEVDAVKLEMAGELDEFYVSAVIAMYKSHLISPAQAKEVAENNSEEIIARIYQQYEDQLQKTNRIDKNDVSSLAVQVLLENAELRAKYQNSYEFILVDEYQESTVAQDMLVRILAAPQDNLFVCGDDDETISENRNACPELLADYSLRFPNARCMIMEHNFRCHPTIVEHARCLLAYLERRKIKKEFVSAWGAAPSSAVFGPQALSNEQEEVAWVVQQVRALVDAGRGASQLAILYRQGHYEALIEEQLVKAGLPFHASHSDSSMIPDEAGDMVAFLKLVMDPDGPRAREAFERVCQIGTKEIDPKLSATIASFASANNLSYLKAIEIYAEATADQGCKELEQLVKVIRAMNQDKLPPAESIGYLRRTRRLNDYYKSVKIPPGQIYEPLKRLGQLEEHAKAFSSVAEFVQHVEERLGDEQPGEEQAVYVKSIFDIKGHEFPIVFLTGLAEGVSNSPDLEEERRQFYVALTRAREAVFLSYPVTVSGKASGPSRFLVEAQLISASAMPELRPPVGEPISPAVSATAANTAQTVQAAPNDQHLGQQLPLQQVQPTAGISPVSQQQPKTVSPQVVAEPSGPAQTTQPVNRQMTPTQLPPNQLPAAHQQNENIVPAAQVSSQHAAEHHMRGPGPQEFYESTVSKRDDDPTPAANNGDPFAAKEKVTGLSPYVDNPEPVPNRGMSYLPPPKGAASPPQVPGSEPALPIPSTSSDEPKMPDSYSLVPPGPPGFGKAGKAPSGAAPSTPENSILPAKPGPSANAIPPSSYPSQQAQPGPYPTQASQNYVQPQAHPQPVQQYKDEPVYPQQQFTGEGSAQSFNREYQAPHMVPEGTPICPGCGTGLEANALFCGECGYSLPQRIPACVGCGNPLEPEAKFCGECGTPVQQANPAAEGEKKQGWVGKFMKFLEE